MRPKTLVVAAALALLSAAATAQQATTQRLRGVIEAVDGRTLTVKAPDGGVAKLTLNDNAQVVVVVKATMADIKPNTFLGSAAMPQPDGTQKALEVHIFPEAMRGTGEGHRPYAPVSGSTMTNGTADGAMVTGINGGTMTLKYKDGDKTIVVPPDVPITRYEIGTVADLKPGAAFAVLAATKRADGMFEASRINVGRDGVTPN